jgi:predicted secreted hydrolase
MRSRLRRQGLVLFGLMLLATTACVTSVEPREVPSGAIPDPTAIPAPIVFPLDEFAHESRLEWWYNSGHLRTEKGREFGFHFVVFKADDGLGEPNLVAQLGILEVETGEHYELSRAEAGFRITEDPLNIHITDWIYAIWPDSGHQQWSTGNGEIVMSLEMSATSPPMLHNEIGWLPTDAGATYYYSWPRQSAVGTIKLGDETFEVTGTSWFDHQWGDFFVLGKPAGWQWFALQLEDGGSLMITESRGLDGKIVDTYGTYMSPDGEVRSLQQSEDGIDLTAIGEWNSPTTGATYPSGWSLSVESLGMDLIINPVANDQEVQGGLPAASTYWEGKAWIDGTQNGQPISGDAYVELSGYVDPEPIEWMHR